MRKILIYVIDLEQVDRLEFKLTFERILDLQDYPRVLIFLEEIGFSYETYS